MTSILTNTSAMTALQGLATTQRSLAKVQKQIATGLAVNDASDNPGAWSMATSMRADVAALGTVTNSINVGLSIVSTATPAITSTLNLLTTLKSTLGRVVSPASGNISASAGDTMSSIQSAVAAQQQSIIALMGSSSFGGINMLDGSAGTINVIDTYARNPNGTNYGSLSMASSITALGGTAAAAPSGTTGGGGLLGGTLGATSAAGTAGSTSSSGTTYAGTFASDSILGFQLTATTTAADFAKISQALDTAITKVTNAGAQIGTYSTVLNNQSIAISALTDNMNTGIGALVDADMNVASARLQALQVQQQLGIQSLAIANENAQLVLKLFGN